MNSNMKERFSIRSGLVVVVFLTCLCDPTEQRPHCSSPTDCGENDLGAGEDQFNTKYISRIEHLSAMKQLMETLLMQHNEFASLADEEENSTEKPPTENSLNVRPITGVEENTTDRTISDKVEENSTERPPIRSSLAEVLNGLRMGIGNGSEKSSDEFPTAIKKTEDDEIFFEVTTIEPQQLVSPLETHEFHFETTTIQPRLRPTIEPIVEDTTQSPVASKNHSPTKANTNNNYNNNKNKKRKITTTKGPHVIIHPQQLAAALPSSGNILGNPTKDLNDGEKISSLTTVDPDHEIKGEIQLETLNRPISTSKPFAAPTPNLDATSNRPKEKPINITPETSAVKKGPLKPSKTEVGNLQGSPGIPKPLLNSVAAATVAPQSASASASASPSPSSSSPRPTEPEDEDYLISALASIADAAGGGGGDGDDDEEDGEDEDAEEVNSSENEGEDEEEEDDDEDDEEEEEDEYLTSSGEERENSVDASDVLSSVMEEVGALI